MIGTKPQCRPKSTKTCHRPPMMAPASQGAKPNTVLTPAAMPRAAKVVSGPTVMRTNGTITRMMSSGVVKFRMAEGSTRLRNRST